MPHLSRSIDISDPLLLELGELADRCGVELYVVGGYVRDYLRKADRTDIDCTVVGDAPAFAREVAQHFHSRPVIYERFRTAMVPVGEYKLEFVGTRREEYEPGSRNPIVSEGTLDDDLARRDFTVNAMAARLNRARRGELIDRFDGLGDLERGLLRTPLDPITTFNDDPLRMMRAARFSSQLNFELDAAAMRAMQSMSERITIVAQERITDEFMKTLAAPVPSTGLRIMFHSGLLKHVFPEVHRLAGVDVVSEGSQEYAHKDVFFHTLKVLDNVADMSDNVWLRFAALMHDIAKPRTKKFIQGTGWTFHGHEDLGARWQKRIFRKLKLPMAQLDYVQTLVSLHQRPMVLVDDGVTDSAVRRLIVQAGEALDDLFLLCRADITSRNPARVSRYLGNYDLVYEKICEVREKDQLRAFQSPVRGEEIMEICELKPSRLVGVIKANIEEAILDGQIPNEYEAAKKYLLDHKDDWMAEAVRKS